MRQSLSRIVAAAIFTSITYGQRGNSVAAQLAARQQQDSTDGSNIFDGKIIFFCR
jgi:hypothetical protein